MEREKILEVLKSGETKTPMERAQEGNDRRNTEAADKAAEKKIAEAEAKLAREDAERKAEQARADQAAATAAIDVPVVSAEAIEPLSTEAAAELKPVYTTNGWQPAGYKECPAGWKSRWTEKEHAVASLLLLCNGTVTLEVCRYADVKHPKPIQIEMGSNSSITNYADLQIVAPVILCSGQEEKKMTSFQLFVGENKTSK